MTELVTNTDSTFNWIFLTIGRCTIQLLYLYSSSLHRKCQKGKTRRVWKSQWNPSKKKKDFVQMIRNKELKLRWKLGNNATWNTTFCHTKTLVGPLLSLNCCPCLKFQVKGCCFNNCKQKASHYVLANDYCKKVDAFINLFKVNGLPGRKISVSYPLPSDKL